MTTTPDEPNPGDEGTPPPVTEPDVEGDTGDDVVAPDPVENS